MTIAGTWSCAPVDIIRGKLRITSSETNLRELFVDADYSPLISKSYSEVMSDLIKILDCLKYINFKQSDSTELSKWMQVIRAYSNQYPNYAIVTFLFTKGFDHDSELIELLQSMIRYVYYAGSTTSVKFEIYNIIKAICNDEFVSGYRTRRDIDTKLYYHPRLRKGFALLSYYLQGGKPLADYVYDKILTYKDSEGLFKDEQQAVACIESIGNDIIIDKPKKHLDWIEKRSYYSTSGITEVNEITKETNIVALIEKRTKMIQATLDNYFFKD